MRLSSSSGHRPATGVVCVGCPAEPIGPSARRRCLKDLAGRPVFSRISAHPASSHTKAWLPRRMDRCKPPHSFELSLRQACSASHPTRGPSEPRANAPEPDRRAQQRHSTESHRSAPADLTGRSGPGPPRRRDLHPVFRDHEHTAPPRTAIGDHGRFKTLRSSGPPAAGPDGRRALMEGRAHHGLQLEAADQRAPPPPTPAQQLVPDLLGSEAVQAEPPRADLDHLSAEEGDLHRDRAEAPGFRGPAG
jgi:hypothetical protein